jgi:cystathionine beta-lyase
MKYDFTSYLDRRGKDAAAYDSVGQTERFGFAPDKPKEGFDVIPMWIADMNFPTVPTIPQAMIERAQHPAYGYYLTPDEYYDAIISWQKDRNKVEKLTADHIDYLNGVLGGVAAALKVLCGPGDPVLVHRPTYVGFTGTLKINGYKIVHSDLKKDENGVWRMDYEDMEKKIQKYHIHAAIFCSPHNPTGRVWEKEEIEKAMEVYRRNQVYIIADEIWSDLILDGNHHIPTQSVSEDARQRTIALYAPSKTFNLAGLVGSYSIIYNDWLRERYLAELGRTHLNAMNVLSMHALLGAYSQEGREWVDELRDVLTENVKYAVSFINDKVPGAEVSMPQGTYMLYIDFSGWCHEHGKTLQELKKAGWDVGVDWQDGEIFGKANCIRMNLALPLSRVKEAFDRLEKYVF